MATPKLMKLINPNRGRMECRICGAVHTANLVGGGHYHRGSWQCSNGCRLPLGWSVARWDNLPPDMKEAAMMVRKTEIRIRRKLVARYGNLRLTR